MAALVVALEDLPVAEATVEAAAAGTAAAARVVAVERAAAALVAELWAAAG